jgi:hypothetical protein
MNLAMAPQLPLFTLRVAFATLVCTLASGCLSAADDAASTQADDTTAETAGFELTLRDPRGIYHNAFSGDFSGNEWFQVTKIAGQNRYQMADLFGGGFVGTINADGSVVLDGGVGGGRFESLNAFTIKPKLGRSIFTFDSVRAPRTIAAFPLEAKSAVAGNSALAGNYTAAAQQLDPRTGAVRNAFSEKLMVAVNGSTFRMTDPQGLYFQGVFFAPTQVAFRAVAGAQVGARFRSFPGSAINFQQDMVGEVTVADTNHWTATILLQSRAPLGAQVQQLFRFSASR